MNRTWGVLYALFALSLLALPAAASARDSQAQVVSFRGDAGRTLAGLIYEPEGPGPFPGLIYNHGSAPGRENDQAFERLGPAFASHGWVFFAPYRRGQGLSAGAGGYVLDELASAAKRDARRILAIVLPAAVCVLIGILAVLRRRRAWVRLSAGTVVAVLGLIAFQIASMNARASSMVHLLETEQLQDHLAAYEWLREQPFIDPRRIATAGNSFGGIISILAAERVPYCAAVDAAGGSESWFLAPSLQRRMIDAARAAQAPLFLFQAQNDYTTAPTRTLSAALQDSGKPFRSRIYPAYGKSPAEGHSFAWRGVDVWSPDVVRFLNEHCK